MLAFAVIVSIELPEMVIEVGANVAVSPAGAVAERLTVPLKPPVEFTVIVVVLDEDCATITVVGLAVTVKSVTLTVTIVLCERVPLVPVTVTV
jgi:hypothetical protein